MITFSISILLLIVGYIAYGKLVANVFGIKPERPTPCMTSADGVDYVALPTWRVFLIQFLNIAGLGPIFGAIMGIMFGPAAYLWIVFGCIFGGAVHDFLSGMMSIRQNGASLPEIAGYELGTGMKQFMRGFAVVLMILVGAVFVSGPAGLLHGMISSVSINWWIAIVFIYYIAATLLPIDKLIGKIYPIFGAALLFMAVGIFVALYLNHAPIPEITDGLASRHPKGYPIFPMMFVSIACGAVSGFHATQSPLMARCLKNEKYARPVFYGAMIAEGIVALIWAAAASSFFGGLDGLLAFAAEHKGQNIAVLVVNEISNNWLGSIGGILAIMGVVAAPITSGDTALRTARLIVADFMKVDQKPLMKRLAISLPIFALSFVLLQVDFSILWRYFAWSNQILAMITLWAITVYLARKNKAYMIALVPALFMTAVCSMYLFVSPDTLGLSMHTGYGLVAVLEMVLVFLFFRWKGHLCPHNK